MNSDKPSGVESSTNTATLASSSGTSTHGVGVDRFNPTSAVEVSSEDTTPVEPTPTKKLSSSQLLVPAADVGVSSAAVQSIASASSSRHASGSSSPARLPNTLHQYHLDQQKLLSQQIHHHLANPDINPTAATSLAPPVNSSAGASTPTSPQYSGRSSLEQSTRSSTRPTVLETNKLDIQTHTSGRRMVNQYVIEGELGRGVHGKVRLARDVETGERVAVKIVEREARKRLGAGLLNRANRGDNKERLRLSKIVSESASDAVAQPARETPIDNAASAAAEEHALPSTPSTRFAPLPTTKRQPSTTNDETFGNNAPQETDAEKARKALLWTTDQKVRREIAIMKKCCHENVVSLKEDIDDPQSKKVFMVLEYMEGGEIVWKDAQGRPTLKVDESRSILRDVVCGLEYLHYQGIIHRDIKPANLLWGKDKRVKISDFGVSHFSYAMMIANDRFDDTHNTTSSSLLDDRELAKTAGSPAFFAPELCTASDISSSSSSTSLHLASGLAMSSTQPKPATKKHKITKAIDVWALGVTLYCLLFGHTPFTAESEYALFSIIPSTDYSIPITMGSDNVRVGARHPRWKSQCQWVDEEADAQDSVQSPDVPLQQLSEDARQLRDLLDRLLEKDPTKRITLQEVKKHPWIMQGLHDPPAWLSRTDPSQHPFVEISRADVEEALTGFSRLKQRVKKWQAKLLDSLGGRSRSRSIATSSAFFTHHDQKTTSGSSSPYLTRGGHHEESNSSSPVETFGSASNSLRTSRTSSRAHSFFSRQKSAGSVGKKDGSKVLLAMSVNDASRAPPQQSVAQDNVAPPTHLPSPPSDSAKQTAAALHQSPNLDTNLMQPPVAQRRSSSRSASADTGLRPDVTPDIPQRKSSDVHAAQKHSTVDIRLEASSAASSDHFGSPQVSSQDHGADRSFESADRGSMASISQASRISGRHRLGDFLRGNWLMHSESRPRSMSRSSLRDTHESGLALALDTSSGNLNGLSIDTMAAVQEAGARPQAGTPVSAPFLTGGGQDGSRLSLDLLSDSLETPRGKTSFAAASQPTSPPGPQTFAFDNFGRRLPGQVVTPLSEQDDVDLDLDLSDDDFDDGVEASGPMLANSGAGWSLRQDSFMPEVVQHKLSAHGSDDFLTASVEGGYNVFKPPYQHILPSPGTQDDDVEPMVRSGTLSADMGASAEAAALQRATVHEPQDEFSMPSSASHSRSASGKQSVHEWPQQAVGERLADTSLDTVGTSPKGDAMITHSDTSAAQAENTVEDSRFADADEERSRADTDARHTLSEQGIASNYTAQEADDDEDSDEAGISFKAKKSSRLLRGGSGSKDGQHSNTIR